MKAKALLVCALVACGGEIDGNELPDRVPNESLYEQPDVGSIEQEAVSQFGYGFNGLAATHGVQNFACANRTTDNCIYPRDRSRRFCVDSTSMTPAQFTEANADVDAILPTLTSQFGAVGWTFSRNCSSPDVQISYGSVPGTSFVTSILPYVSITAQSGGLTQVFPSGAGGNHWQQTSGPLFVMVDRAQIVLEFGSAADEQRVRRHAIYGGMYAGGVGLGFTSAHTNRVTSIPTTPGVAKLPSVSTSEQCRVNNYDPTDPTFWIQTFGC